MVCVHIAINTVELVTQRLDTGLIPGNLSKYVNVVNVVSVSVRVSVRADRQRRKGKGKRKEMEVLQARSFPFSFSVLSSIAFGF